MRKYIYTIISFATTISLVACGNTSDTSNENPSNTVDTAVQSVNVSPAESESSDTEEHTEASSSESPWTVDEDGNIVVDGLNLYSFPIDRVYQAASKYGKILTFKVNNGHLNMHINKDGVSWSVDIYPEEESGCVNAFFSSGSDKDTGDERFLDKEDFLREVVSELFDESNKDTFVSRLEEIKSEDKNVEYGYNTEIAIGSDIEGFMSITKNSVDTQISIKYGPGIPVTTEDETDEPSIEDVPYIIDGINFGGFYNHTTAESIYDIIEEKADYDSLKVFAFTKDGPLTILSDGDSLIQDEQNEDYIYTYYSPKPISDVKRIREGAYVETFDRIYNLYPHVAAFEKTYDLKGDNVPMGVKVTYEDGTEDSITIYVTKDYGEGVR